MTHRITRKLACAAFISTAFTTLTVAEPLELVPVVDTHTAARAIMETGDVASAALRPLDAMTVDARLLVLRTLSWLDAATTPGAVAAARRGVSVPCPLGGHVLALLPKTGKRVLRLTWTGCQYENGSQRETVDGSGEAQLPAATFAPSYLLSLHLGTLGEDLISAAAFTDDSSLTERHFNLHVDGHLPLTRFRNVGIFTGAYDVTIDGKVDNHYSSPGVPGPEGYPPYDSWYYQHADDLRLVGSTTHSENDTVLDEQVNFRYGTFRQIGAAANLPFPESSWPSLTGRDLRVRRVLRALEGISTATADGEFRTTRNPYAPCDDGWFSIRTLTPVRLYDAFGNGGEDAGSAIINGARITYRLTDGPADPSWYTPRPGEQPTKVTVNMSNGGTFELTSYFVSSLASQYLVCAP